MVNKEKLVEGAIFWCILPSSESMNYENTRPCQPWQGKLSIEKRTGGTVFLLSRFNKDTGKVSDDSNAIALLGIRPEYDLFETEEEAQQSYIVDFLYYCKESAKQTIGYLEDLVNYMEGLRQVKLPKE